MTDETDKPPAPEVLATEIAEDLEAALAYFAETLASRSAGSRKAASERTGR